MVMTRLNQLTNNAGIFLTRNSPTIMTSLGVGSLLGAIGVGILVTPRAIAHVLDDGYAEDNLYDDPGLGYGLQSAVHDLDYFEIYVKKLTRKQSLDVIKAYYIPTIGLVGLGLSAIFLGNRVHIKRTYAMASAYTILDQTLREYKTRVGETVTKAKAREIESAVDLAVLKDNPADARNTHNIGGGKDLCFEPLTGRYFYSDAEKVRRAVNSENARLMSDSMITLNEVLYEFGLPAVNLGHALGWASEDGLIDVELSARVVDPDEKPCLVIRIDPGPRPLWS